MPKDALLNGDIKEIADYEILRKLGEGGMGMVFLARQKSLDRTVALKVLAPAVAKDKQFIERFQREARATGNLNHPNIVQGIDVAQDPKTGLWHFAMEFVNGASVSRMLKTNGAIPERRALQIVRQIASALECAEKHGFVHRDIKPDNILLTAGGDAKLADLGLAKRTEDHGLTMAGQLVGTPHYMSPEQAQGQDLDIRSDIYSLGATLFHMVTGRTPFEGNIPAVIAAMHIQEPMRAAREVNPNISEECSKLIAKMTQKDRSKRIRNPAELSRQIDKIMAGDRSTSRKLEPVGAASTTKKEVPVSRDTSSNGLLIAAGGVMILLIGAVYYATSSPPPQHSVQPVVVAQAPRIPPITPAIPSDSAAPAIPSEAPAPVAVGEKPAARPKPAETPALEPVNPLAVSVSEPKPEAAQAAAPAAPTAPTAPTAPDGEKRPAVPVVDEAARELALAESKAAAYLTRFDADALSGKYEEAKKIADEARTDPVLKPLGVRLDQFVAIAQALTAADDARLKMLNRLKGTPQKIEVGKDMVTGVVEKVALDVITVHVKVDGADAAVPVKWSELSVFERNRLGGVYVPATPPEHLALAIRALVQKELNTARAELAASKELRLAGHYEKKADELAVAQLEAEAKKAWEALHITAQPPANKKLAQEVIDKIAEFEKKFGQTGFATANASAIAAAKTAAQKMLCVVKGIYQGRERNGIAIKIDGKDDPEHFAVSDPAMRLKIEPIVPSNRVTIEWKEVDGQKEVTAFEALIPKEKEGKVVGHIVAIGGNGFFDVQPDGGGEIERYLPRWLGGMPANGGGPDRAIMDVLAKKKVGDPIKVEWMYDNRKRATKVE